MLLLRWRVVARNGLPCRHHPILRPAGAVPLLLLLLRRLRNWRVAGSVGVQGCS